MIYLDTHVVAWLYAGATRMLSRQARDTIERESLLVSSMVILELEFLREIGKITTSANAIIEELRARIGLEVCDLAFERIISAARDVSWTRDPFDRVIIGHALATGRGLLTKDRPIRRRIRSAIW